MPNIQYTPYIGDSMPKWIFSPNIPEQQEIHMVERTPQPYVRQFDLSTPVVRQQSPLRTPEITPKEISLNVANANLENLNTIATKLRDAGFTNNQQAAILATVVAESGANPTAIGDAGRARGLFQWHAPRFNAGDDLDSQIQLIINELRDKNNLNAWTNSKYYKKQQALDLFDNGDLRDTIAVLTTNFIRPANQAKEIEKRLKIAQQIQNQLTQYVRRP